MSAAEPPVCFQARKVLRLSAGRRRVALEELAPAKFNRHGAALSGRRIKELAERIMRAEGFAAYRYGAGWCHAPDPSDPLG
eukprot:8982571-Alexandrium_andersonii.AAC.1